MSDQKKYKIEYKIQQGDTYDKLVQRYGSSLLLNAGITKNEDIKPNSIITFRGLTSDEVKTIQNKTQAFLDNYNKQRELAYIKENRDYIDRESWWQGKDTHGKSDEELLSDYKDIISDSEKEQHDRAVHKEKMKRDASIAADLAEKHKKMREQGIINEETAKFSKEMQFARERANLLTKYENGEIGNSPIIRSLTLNGNTDKSIEAGLQNLEDQHKSAESTIDLTKKAATGIVGLAGGTALAPIAAPAVADVGAFFSSKPVSLALGGYGIYDSVSDMAENGINLQNSIQLAGSTLPFLKYTKLRTPIMNAIGNSKLGTYFNKTNITETAEALAQTQKANPVTKKQVWNLITRYRFPDVVKGGANLVQDIAAATTGSNLSQKVTDKIDQNWDYNYDENGNIIRDANYYTKNSINSALNTLGFTFGLGARTGNTARSLMTGSLAYGPGSYMLREGLNAVENKYDLSDNKHWGRFRNASELIAPVLLHGTLNRGISFGKQKLGRDLTQADIQALNTTAKDAVIDELIEEGIAMPIAKVANSLLPEDLRDESTTAQIASMIGGRMNHRQMVADALEATAGAQKYGLNTVGRVAESLLADDLLHYRYTGRYKDGDKDTRGNTQDGSIFGVEGANANKKGKGVFNRYNESLGKNFSERREGALPSSWWNIFSGAYTPKVGEQFSEDSRIVRYDSDHDGRTDYVSSRAKDLNDGKRVVEIRTDGFLGTDDVPVGLSKAIGFGISRSDQYFTGPSGNTLNTVGANGIVYKDDEGRLKGFQLVDETAPGVRRIQPSNTAFGKAMHLIAHPIKTLSHPRKWLRGDFSKGDDYYNKDSEGKKGDLVYLTTSLATSAVNGLKRNNVFTTTGYKSFADITEQDFKASGKIRTFLFNPNKLEGQKVPTANEIIRKYKGTELESATFGEKLEHFVNELNAYEGNSLGEKYQNYYKLGQVGNPSKTQTGKRRRFKMSNEQKELLRTEQIIENWLSSKNPNFYTKDKNKKTIINTKKLEQVFGSGKNPKIKEVYFMAFPEEIRNYIKSNYNFELYKRGGIIRFNSIGL